MALGSETSGPPMADDSGGTGVLSEMSEKMRIKDDDDDRTVLSKKLSYVLRHGAKQLDLEIDTGGYVCVSDLLACGELFAGVVLEALIEVVEQSNRDKQRYEILQRDDGEWLIRATGKHTMQGLARAEAKDKKARRVPGKEALGSPTASGEHSRGQRSPGGARPIAEDEFCAKWRLDRLARVRLADLSPANRQLAMQRFNPGPQVPPSDFPKVFVAFCKRFRVKGKDDKDGFDDQEFDAEDLATSPAAGRSGSWTSSLASGGKTSKSKKKSSKGGNEALTSLVMDDIVAETEFDGGPYPAYSTPRSDIDDRDSPGGLSIHSLGTPVRPPGHPPPAQPPPPPLSPQTPNTLRQLSTVPAPPQSPPLANAQFVAPVPKPPTAPPPPTYAPNARLPSNMSLRPAPPPPTHAPQVGGFGFGVDVEPECNYRVPNSPHSYGTSPAHRAPGVVGYQEVAMMHADYNRYFDGSNSYGHGVVQHGYHEMPQHLGGRSPMAYVTQAEHMQFHGMLDPSPGSQDNRGTLLVGAGWQMQANSDHSACY